MLPSRVEKLLSDYFSWDLAELRRLYYRSESISTGISGGSGYSPEEVAYVDFVITHIRNTKPETYRIMARVFEDGKTIRWMSDRGEGNKDTMAQRLREGKSMVETALLLSTQVR